MKEKNYTLTINACFTGYIVQAIINNFVPLLFLTFVSEYHIPLWQITLLVTFNFGVQLCVDLLSAAFVDLRSPEILAAPEDQPLSDLSQALAPTI